MQPKHTEPLFIQAAAAAAAAGLLQGHDSEGTKNQLTSVTLAWRQNQTPVYFHCTGNGYCELQRLNPQRGVMCGCIQCIKIHMNK